MSRLTVLVCEDWESGQQQGGKAKCWCLPLSPCPPSLSQDCLLKAACRPGWGRSWQGCRHLGGSLCRAMVLLALDSLSLLLLLLQLGAGGALSVGSWQAGDRQLLGFYSATGFSQAPAIQLILLLPCCSLCYPLLSYSFCLWSKQFMLFWFPGAEGLLDELISVPLLIFPSSPSTVSITASVFFSFHLPTAGAPFFLTFFILSFFFSSPPCTSLSL